MADVDLVVLGGGLAGLSLAERLAAAGQRAPRTVVLEARDHYEDDRTWCFWRPGPHRYEGLVSATWRRCAVRHAGREVRIDCAETPYQMIPSGAFYARASAGIAANPRVSLELGCAVAGEPLRTPTGWSFDVGEGRSLRARHVVDTRPPKTRPASILWQSFVGDVVTAESDAFDPEVAVLMDFDADSTLGVLFVYVLPTSPRRALVETTVFGSRPLGPDALRSEHESRLRARLGDGAFTIDRSEHGVLPMGNEAVPSSSGAPRAGLYFGGARPSTGYAFLRVQDWAETCAGSLLRGAGPCGPRPDPWLRRAMDEVFLRVLRAHPERGGELLLRLFERADPARVIRFLGDRGGLGDALAMIRALPPGPFVRHALAAALRVPCRGSA
ncbi:MAG: lycopene cyclase family protein [Planctomycetota bacterium]|nr:lycopene cyclase family protein [Planctomycetota bacterium]